MVCGECGGWKIGTGGGREREIRAEFRRVEKVKTNQHLGNSGEVQGTECTMEKGSVRVKIGSAEGKPYFRHHIAMRTLPGSVTLACALLSSAESMSP